MAWSGSSTTNTGAARGNATAHGGNSTHGGGAGQGGGKTQTMQAMFAARQKVTEQQLMYFAAGICGLIAIFIVLHWTRYLYGKVACRSSSTSVATAPFSAVTRAVRRLLIRKVPRFNSGGHALLVAAYVGINCAVLFTNIDLSGLSIFAARAGWLTAGNLAFVVFLALKNTPLAFLTAYSYERLNCLHQIAGCLTFLMMVLHAACYTSYFANHGLINLMVEREQIAGIIAGFAFLSVTVSALVLRRIWYELFYVTHLVFFIIGIISVCFHRPEFGEKIDIIMFSVAAMWVVDRLIRIFRALYYVPNNFATVHPLPNGGTKVVLKKVPTRAVPGKHFYVWIPAIRMFEMHPFTIVGTQPLEFIIKSHNGFTRDLHKYAAKHPGAALRASVDGPYGTFPDPMEYDKIVLIAGGGGASFTFGLAVNLLERMKSGSNKTIAFIWTVKQHDDISWFTQHLETLKTDNNAGIININLFVTRAPASPDGLDILHHHHHEERDESAARHDRMSTTSETSSSSPISPTCTTLDPEKASSQAHLAPQSQTTTTTTTSSLTTAIDREMEQRVDDAHRAAVSATAGVRTSVVVQPVDADAASSTTDSDSDGGRRRHHRIAAGRPDTATLIREEVMRAARGQRVLVAACGPGSLMTVVRDTTARLVRADGPAVELHCEQFGW